VQQQISTGANKARADSIPAQIQTADPARAGLSSAHASAETHSAPVFGVMMVSADRSTGKRGRAAAAQLTWDFQTDSSRAPATPSTAGATCPPAEAPEAPVSRAQGTESSSGPALPPLPLFRDDPRLALATGDLVLERTDAIVTAANAALLGGGGVDAAVHQAAGRALWEACARIRAEQGGCRPGSAVSTGPGALPVRGIIHAVGPRWRGGQHGEDQLLIDVHRAVCARARENGWRSIALPALSTGAYRVPMVRAAHIALTTLADELARTPESFDLIRVVLWTPEARDCFETVRATLRQPP